MANLFLGFPVPRAKIADMIAGSAPPTIHHTQHEKNGADEIDCTGLTGAGGGAAGYDDPGYYFSTWFESLNGYYTASSPTGMVTINSNNLYLATDGGGADWASINKEPSEFVTPWNWAKISKFKTEVTFSAFGSSLPKMDILWGNADNNRHFGFVVRDGLLKASVADGSAETLSDTIEDWGETGYYETRLLEAVLESGQAKFYVNGILKATLTTGLPVGTDKARMFIKAYLRANGSEDYHEIILSYWQAWKEK